MKGDKMAKRSSFGSMRRRRLSDITNSSPQPKSPSFPGKLAPDNVSATEYIDHLFKEKTALVKLIQDKNKIIELSGIEIQKLQTCLQKMQLQNWTLAQTNSQMLAEINLGKERLKALQHEVACKEILLKTKNLQLKVEKEKVNVQRTESQEPEAVTKGSENNGDNTRPCNASRRRRLSRSRSLGSSAIPQQHVEKEAAVCERRCLRRQSTSSRTNHEESTDDKLFEIDVDKFPEAAPSKRSTDDRSLGSSAIPQQHVEKEAAVSKRRCLRRQSNSSRTNHEEPTDDKLFEIDVDKFPEAAPSKRSTEGFVPSRLTSSSSGVVSTDGSRIPELETEARRTSISRPSRRAAEKVQTYKERSIKVKMRRQE